MQGDVQSKEVNKNIPKRKGVKWCKIHQKIHAPIIRRFQHFGISISVTKVVDISGTAGVTQEHFLMNSEHDEMVYLGID